MKSAFFRVILRIITTTINLCFMQVTDYRAVGHFCYLTYCIKLILWYNLTHRVNLNQRIISMEVVTLSLTLIVIVLALIKLIIEQPCLLLCGAITFLIMFVSFWFLPATILISYLLSIFIELREKYYLPVKDYMNYFIQDK